MKPTTVASLLLLYLCGLLPGAVRGQAQEKLNIIYILADDLGYGDLGAYGQTRFATPNIDRLAARGMVFTDHYSGSTVCAPSRSVLMTGQHSGRTPIRNNSKNPNGPGQLPLPDGSVTVAEVLKQIGYATGAFGKWGLGYTGTEGDPSRQGFDVFFGYKDQVNAHSYYPEILWDNNEKVGVNEKGARQTYAPFLIQKHTLDFIRENKDRPFFCYIPSVIPHAELLAPEDRMERFRGKFGTETPFKDGQGRGEASGYAAQAEPRAAFAAMVQILDEQVGEIVALVEELGLADRTIILFTSDNGPHDAGGGDPEYFDGNGPLRGLKRDLYEGGIRVPMIAWGPGRIAEGSRTAHVSAFWDVLPTLADLAGAPVPQGVDGLSFAPTLLNRGQQAVHPYLYWEFFGGGGKRAVRMGPWKGVQLTVAKSPDAPIELYDLSTDLSETRNVAGDHPEVVARMKAAMREAHLPPVYPQFSFFPAQATAFLFEMGPLVLTADSLRDANGSFTLAQLPVPEPKRKVGLKAGTTPLTQRMWEIALDDVERNQVTNDAGVVYFGAGSRYGDRVYTRDISIAGVLGANQLYPEEMLSSLKLTREIRAALGYRVSVGHDIREIDVPWEVIAEKDSEIMAKYKTNSYTRRTDDVVWLWATDDLFTRQPQLADWQWMLETGQSFFEVFYDPWFDPADGLYRGQPLYHDITNSAYPKGMTNADCVLLKSLSTNCLYYRGMLAMANASEEVGRPAAERQQWLDRAAALKVAIVKEFTKADGTLAYYKDRHGVIMPNREILGTAFAVIFGILDGPAARAAYEGYPITDKGIPLFSPFIPGNSGPHNMASWPFCDTFFLWGKEMADGVDYTPLNAALLGRSLGTAFVPKKAKAANESDWGTGLGSFHEKIPLPAGLIDGSGHQLWSAAAFLNVCLRAGIVDFENQ